MSEATKSGSRKTAVFVEIGGDWLKIIQTEPAKGGIAISKMHLERFESAGAALSASISRAYSLQGFAKVPAVACLPRQMVTVRMLELPSTNPAEIADMVDLQIGKQTPYSKDEIVSDYRLIKAGRPGYTGVILGIVQRSVLSLRYYLLEEAGVEVERMAISSEGLLSWFVQTAGKGDGRASALIDVDSFYSDFAVIADGTLVFTRSILVGANELLSGEAKWRDNFAREVRRSLEMCRSELGGLNVGKLVLTGAAANIKDLDGQLGGPLNLPVEVRDPLQGVSATPKTPSLKDGEFARVSLTSLIGSAMRPESLEFNLVPETVTLRRRLVEKARSLTALAALVMAALVSVSMYGTLKLYLKKSRLDAVRSAIRQTEPAAKRVETMRGIVGVVAKRSDLRFSALALLTELQKALPEDVYFDRISLELDKGQVGLQGTGGSRSAVFTLIRNLEQSTLMADVKEGGPIALDKNGRFRFQLVGGLEKAE